MSNKGTNETGHNEKLMKMAKKRIILKKSIIVHLTIYSVINIFLVAIYLSTSGGYFWPIWSIMGWGVGVILHGAMVLYLLSSISVAPSSTMKEYERLINQQNKN